MNTKKLFSTLVIALLLCTMLSVFALAAGDVFRVGFWDGGSTLPAGCDHFFRAPAPTGTLTSTGSVSNFIYRAEVAKDNLTAESGSVSMQFQTGTKVTIPVDIYEYPYVQIKYRTNSANSMYFRVWTRVGTNNYAEYFYCPNIKAETDGWNTVDLCIPNDGTEGITKNGTRSYYTYRGNQVYTEIGNYSFPSAKGQFEVWQLDIGFSGMSTANLSEDWYAEIEYIAFFKTEEAMDTYAPYKLISFDGKGDINLALSNIVKNDGCGTATQKIENGTYRLEIPYDNPVLAGYSAFYDFNIPENDQFNLNDYPYAMIKYKTNFPATAQFYFSKPGEKWSGLWFGSNNPTESGLSYFQAHFPATTETSYKYKDTTVGVFGTGAFPSESYDATVWKIFLQLKGLTGGQIAEIQEKQENLYFEIEYMAFFKSEEDMDDFYAAGLAPETLGAQVRADGTFGLRFGFALDTALAPAGCEVVEYGAVIGLDGTTPVLGNTAKYAVVSSAKDGFKSATDGTVISYNAVVTNIPDGTEQDKPSQLATKLVARPYVTYTFGGYTYTTYGASVTKSVDDVREASGWEK